MLELAVTGMTCNHCVRAVTEAVSAVPGVLGVAVDLAGAKVQIQGEPDPTAVRAAIEDEGYTVR
jgi:copper chaperone